MLHFPTCTEVSSSDSLMLNVVLQFY